MNSTDKYRRAFYTQYSSEVLSVEGSRHSCETNLYTAKSNMSPLCFAIPCKLDNDNCKVKDNSDHTESVVEICSGVDNVKNRFSDYTNSKRIKYSDNS